MYAHLKVRPFEGDRLSLLEQTLCLFPLLAQP